MEDKIAVSVWRLPVGHHHFAVDGVIKIVVSENGVTVLSHPHTTCAERKAYSKRYVCKCDPAIADDLRARYAQQVIVDLPDGKERQRRIAEGLDPRICIDPCIVDVIKDLWSKGIETLGCCCGHTTLPGYVDVDEKDFDKMLALGFEKWPVSEHGHGQNAFLI